MNPTTDTTWQELFPAGRHIYYEGDDPEGFAATIKAEFGFDPSEDPRWKPGWGPEFHCPSEHLDAIYGSDRWQMGA